MIYSELVEEYKALRGKLLLLNGVEHEAAIARLKEIDKVLKNYDRSLPRFTGGSTNYKSTRLEKAIEETEVHRLTCNLIMDSWWTSWLPFGWMHSLAASYYARKARRVYKNQKRPA